MVARGRSNTTAAPGPCNIPGGRDACNQGRCLPITDAYPAGGRKLLRCRGWGPAAHTLRSKAVRPCGPGPCSSRLSLGEFQKPAATHASLRTEGSREALVLLQLWQACAVLKCVKPAFKNRGRSHWCLEMAGLTALGRGPCGSMGGVGGRGFGRLLLLGPPCPLQHPLTLSQKPPGPGAPVCALRPTWGSPRDSAGEGDAS